MADHSNCVTVRAASYKGAQAIIASSRELDAIIVPAWGSRIVALRCKRTGISLLREPVSEEAYLQSPLLYGTPVLFPPNRIADGRFSAAGSDYQFDINEPERSNHAHGLVHDKPWVLEKAVVETVAKEWEADPSDGSGDAGRNDGSDGSGTAEPKAGSGVAGASVESGVIGASVGSGVAGASVESGVAGGEADAAVVVTAIHSTAHPDIMRQFPHDFYLRMRIEVRGATLIQEVEVINNSEAPFPWGLGYHTAFRFPFAEGGSLAECRLQAPTGLRWLLDERVLPTGELEETRIGAALRAGMAMDGVLLDDLFQSSAVGRGGGGGGVSGNGSYHAGDNSDGAINAVTMSDRAAELQVVYEADANFGQWVLHNASGVGELLCPEPYTCTTNAFNLALPADQTGYKLLEPGGRAATRCSIAIRAWEC